MLVGIATGQDLQDFIRFRMVCGVPGIVAVTNHPLLVDDEYPWQLAYVSTGDSHQMTLRHGRYPPQGQCRRKQIPWLHPLERELFVELSIRIADDGKGKVEFFPEFFRLFRGAHPHQQHPGPDILEPVLVLAQLRRLLTAERSAEVAQKHQHQRRIFPEILELPFCTVRKRYGRIRSGIPSSHH